MWVTLLPLTRSVSKTGPTKATVDERASADVAIQRAAMCLDSIRSDAGNGEQANDCLPSFLPALTTDRLAGQAAVCSLAQVPANSGNPSGKDRVNTRSVGE